MFIKYLVKETASCVTLISNVGNRFYWNLSLYTIQYTLQLHLIDYLDTNQGERNIKLSWLKRYFIIDQQIVQHFLHYSKCLYHPLSSMQLKQLTLFLLQEYQPITLKGWYFSPQGNPYTPSCYFSVESLLFWLYGSMMRLQCIQIPLYISARVCNGKVHSTGNLFKIKSLFILTLSVR